MDRAARGKIRTEEETTHQEGYVPVVTRRELLEAGVHFGHQTRRWNPKMQRYLFGERSGIYIIDLEKSLEGIEETYEFVRDLGRRRGTILFIGTKKQAQEVVEEHANRVGMPFVNHRWLGGMLTNFTTISRRLIRLRELREMESSGAMDNLPKKEVIRLQHEREKLERNLGGIQALERLPDAVFIVDTKKEQIAVTEARKLDIPVIAIVDTNCDPDEVDFVIPGNDDAIRAVSLVTRVVADALTEGYGMAKDEVVEKTRRAPADRRASAIHDGRSRARGRGRAVPRGRGEDRGQHRLRTRSPGTGTRGRRRAGRGCRGRSERDGGGGCGMSDISAEQVKQLRDLTGAGMMDCKRALQETDGDIDKAIELLREKGLASAAKRAGRAANQGRIDSYIHFNNTVGVLLEVNSETDFVANTDEFTQLVKDIALHIASPAAPRWLAREEVPSDVVEQEEHIARVQAKESGKPDNVIDRIVEGKLKAFYEDSVLLDQPFVKDDSKTIQQLLDEVGAKVGEKVAVRRFVRYKLGESTQG